MDLKEAIKLYKEKKYEMFVNACEQLSPRLFCEGLFDFFYGRMNQIYMEQ